MSSLDRVPQGRLPGRFLVDEILPLQKSMHGHPNLQRDPKKKKKKQNTKTKAELARPSG